MVICVAVTDGIHATQSWTVDVTDGPTNATPVFLSSPLMQAVLGLEFAYDALAEDPTPSSPQKAGFLRSSATRRTLGRSSDFCVPRSSLQGRISSRTATSSAPGRATRVDLEVEVIESLGGSKLVRRSRASAPPFFGRVEV